VQVSGNSIENLQGNVYIQETSYQNNKDTYNFDDFNIGLVLMKTGFAPLMSTDIIEGEIVGKFQFAELGNLVKNSLEACTQISKQTKLVKDSFKV
jgi:hypothetical protein